MKHPTYRGQMTRTYAAKKLLEHGPLTASEFQEITRWKPMIVSTCLQRLMGRGEIQSVNLARGFRHYAIVSSSIAHGLQPSIDTKLSKLSPGIETKCLGFI